MLILLLLLLLRLLLLALARAYRFQGLPAYKCDVVYARKVCDYTAHVGGVSVEMSFHIVNIHISVVSRTECLLFIWSTESTWCSRNSKYCSHLSAGNQIIPAVNSKCLKSVRSAKNQNCDVQIIDRFFYGMNYIVSNGDCTALKIKQVTSSPCELQKKYCYNRNNMNLSQRNQNNIQSHQKWWWCRRRRRLTRCVRALAFLFDRWFVCLLISLLVWFVFFSCDQHHLHKTSTQLESCFWLIGLR